MKTKTTKKDLETRLKEAKASQIHNLHFTAKTIEKTSRDYLMGSAVILELTFLGGKKAIEPTAIINGLSKETIESIQKDLKLSYDHLTEFKL